MAAATAERETESPEDRTTRLADFARKWLDQLIASKRGKRLAFGTSTLTLEWRGGELSEVTPSDAPTYR